MKLPFTWISSSVWQTATNTIRTILNLAETIKKNFCFLLKRQKPTPIKVLLRRFPPQYCHYFNTHCKEYEITFHMIIVKLMAKQHKHHQNDFELDRKTTKFYCFFAKTAKVGVQSKYFCHVFPHEITITLILNAKNMKLPFTWSLSSVWQTATNTIRTTLNLAKRIKKNLLFFAKTAKTGVQSKHFYDVFPHNIAISLILIANSMKLPFTWSLTSMWQTATNTIRTTLNLAEKPKKVFVIFAETSKPEVQSK